MKNHERVFRPLRGGVMIFNQRLGVPGTLGLIVTADGADRWILSCFHVLCAADGAADSIYQPIDNAEGLVAVVDPTRANRDRDCAAARIAPGVASVAEILGIGPVGAPAEPIEGMRLLKSGAATGVTEGVITRVEITGVEIEPDGLPADYEMSDAGDSGAVWVTREGNRPVALHQRGIDSPKRLAYGLPFQEALRLLRLEPVTVSASAARGSMNP
ncbi:MAG: hypothetical protein NT090_07395 [Acidobacteria bacterium]|nr:hypothetical protein [Acidobacteriota bacterium]